MEKNSKKIYCIKTLLWNNTFQKKTEISKKTLKIFWEANVQRKHYCKNLLFNETWKKEQMYDIKLEKSHGRLLSIFQNTFAKLYLEKEHWNKPKNS